MNPNADVSAPRAVAGWLFACCALVFAMVVIGGVTRLTHSGLSIVEWQPLVGAVPPLNDAQWQETFAKYKETPEFRLRNHDMTLEGFKGIFWWEYFHRLLGRLVGLVFFVPFAWFVATRRVRGLLAWKLGAILLAGALQGAMGWYMVKSGLVDDPRVSQFRLAAHLGLAFLIYGAMLWLALGLVRGTAGVAHPGPDPAKMLRAFSTTLVIVVFIMVLSGALVAGIRAGFAYNTFPLMNGAVVPPEILMIDPWWKNFGYNMATVQFDHRLIAWLLLALVAAIWLLVYRRRDHPPGVRGWSHALAASFVFQVAIGIATLLLVVPLGLAALHQAGAVIVFTCAIGLRHALGRLQP